MPRDRLLHTYLIGQTGTGKSTLLRQLMTQDLAAGQGFCLIDPHGDLFEAVSEIAGEDTIRWQADNPDGEVGYNPLAPVITTYRPLVVSGLIDTLKRQWSDAWGARMEHLLRFALLALLERPGSTLLDIMPLFLNPQFRNEVIGGIKDRHVRNFWFVEYPALKYQTTADGIAPIANKLGAFLAHPVIRSVITTPENPIRFRKVMDTGQVLLVNLAKGKLGADTANVLGGLILSSIAHAAYSRQDQPERERKPFMVYIDEFHSFTTLAFVDMLSELRKYALGLVISHQHTSQLDEQIREAIFGNVGTMISFRIGATDAGLVSRQFGDQIPQPRDLVSLPNYEMYLKLMIDGVASKPFSAATLAP